VIIFGSRNDVVDLGAIETRHCETCEKLRQFKMILRYKYWSLYWVFSTVAEKHYLVICEVCGRGWELEATTVEPQMGKVPIPFMRRYGFALFVSVGVAVIVFFAMAGAWKP